MTVKNGYEDNVTISDNNIYVKMNDASFLGGTNETLHYFEQMLEYDENMIAQLNFYRWNTNNETPPAEQGKWILSTESKDVAIIGTGTLWPQLNNNTDINNVDAREYYNVYVLGDIYLEGGTRRIYR